MNAFVVMVDVLTPAGLSLSLTIGTGPSGFTGRIQAFVLDVGAINGIFAATRAHDVVLN